jgi:riboflavin synthase
MFTGIIEAMGRVETIRPEGSNVHLTIASPISSELRVDQSVAHNGVCLTAVEVAEDRHTVTAVEESLRRSNLGDLREGSLVNLERAMLAGARLDGHLVQGHVDNKGRCLEVEKRDGSWYFHFEYRPSPEHLLVDKGSICINGVSLTVVVPQDDRFFVAIIPYIYEHTNFRQLQPGDAVNLEFDILGKYIAAHLERYAAAYLKT